MTLFGSCNCATSSAPAAELLLRCSSYMTYNYNVSTFRIISRLLSRYSTVKLVILCCIFIFLRFCNVEISLHFNFAFSLFPSVLLVFTRPLMGNVNFHRYYILRFYHTRTIRENFMHTKIIA